MNRALLGQLVTARRSATATVLVTALDGGRQFLLTEQDADASDELRVRALAALRAGRSECLTLAGRDYFLHVFDLPLRLLVVGAVHIAQALVDIARVAGYRTTVIDPRSAFASRQRFPGVELSHEWPDAALARLRPDHRTAIAALTHDPKIDDPALGAALTSPAFYIGALGSRRTQSARLERLRAQGFGATALAHIRGPIGLAIGAATPAEIAVSIMAEITQTLRRQRESGKAAAPEAPAQVSAVVLAAGRSQRMGPQNKLLLDLGGRSVIEHVVSTLCRCGLREVIVVTGHQRQAIEARLAHLLVRFVHNPDFDQGLSTSLIRGIDAVDLASDAALLCLGDMPQVEAHTIRALVAAFDPVHGKAVCVPVHDGKRGNPVLWSRALFPRLRELRGDVGAKHLMAEMPDRVLDVPVQRDSVLLDIDTPAVYTELLGSARHASSIAIEIKGPPR